jgi:hypothetical protein
VSRASVTRWNQRLACRGPQAMQNAAPASVDELHRAARRAFRRLGRRPDLLHSFFRHAGLALPNLGEAH